MLDICVDVETHFFLFWIKSVWIKYSLLTKWIKNDYIRS